MQALLMLNSDRQGAAEGTLVGLTPEEGFGRYRPWFGSASFIIIAED